MKSIADLYLKEEGLRKALKEWCDKKDENIEKIKQAYRCEFFQDEDKFNQYTKRIYLQQYNKGKALLDKIEKYNKQREGEKNQ